MQSKFKATLKSLKEMLCIVRWSMAYSLKNVRIPTIAFIVIVLLMAFLPYLTNWFQAGLIDSLLKTTTGSGKALFSLNLSFALFIVILTISRLLNQVRAYIDQIYSFDFSEKIIYDMLRSYAGLDLEYWEDAEFNNKLQRIRNNYIHRTKNMISNIIWMIQDLISVVVAIVILFKLSPLLLLLIVVTLIPPLINDVIHGNRLYGIWHADADLQKHFYANSNYLQNEHDLLETKVYGLKEYFMKLVQKNYSDFKTKEKAVETHRTIFATLLIFLTMLGIAVAGWVLVQKVIIGAITIGLLTFYLSSIQQFSWSLSGLLRRFSSLYEDSLFVKDVKEVYEIKPKIVPGTVALPESNTPPLIEFRQVYFKYPNTEKYIFSNLNITIRPGENVAIVGENGAGKTTLVKLLCRFYDVTKGEILIDGVNIKDLKTDSWYEKIAFLTQEFSQYHFDAKTNIAVGNIRVKPTLELVKKAAHLAGADEFINKYPRKYKQVLSRRFEGGLRPSSGQWQKVALARAFFKDAPILIMDEPTSAIDPKAEYQIFQRIFRSYGLKKSIFIISHRFSTVRNAHRILVMKSGRIIESGSHEELYEQGGVYKKTFDLQKLAFE